jgi:hypothetical protein
MLLPPLPLLEKSLRTPIRETLLGIFMLCSVVGVSALISAAKNLLAEQLVH